jgi:hypothetical protein
MTSTTRPRTSTLLAAAILLASAAAGGRASADTIVQVDVSSVIDGRTVSTAQGQTITPWTPGQGIDQDGNIDGYVTNAVEKLLVGLGLAAGGKANPALPDDGMFAADPGGRFPAVQLHFSNTAPTTNPQTHSIKHTAAEGAQSFMFNVPPATYSKLFLIITAAEGAANLSITLNYAGGVAATTQTYMVPDYGVGGATNPNDPTYFNLISKMMKWTKTDMETDGPSHTITGIIITPNTTAMLTSIKVQKTNGSYCVFWGATGIATSAVTTGAGGSAGGGTDGGSTADAGGGAGAGGAAGVTGAGGSTGTGGSATGAAGSTGAGGSATGTAGSTGAGGSTTTTGAAGSTTGTAGSTTGAAGSTTGTTGGAGSVGTKHSSGGGGCALAGAPPRPAAVWLLLAAALAIVVMRRRR